MIVVSLRRIGLSLSNIGYSPPGPTISAGLSSLELIVSFAALAASRLILNRILFFSVTNRIMRRPFDELREVKQEDRFELVLLRGRSLGGQIPPGRERRGERDQPNCGQTSQLTRRPRPGECFQKMRHTIFPYTLRSISWRTVGSPNSAW